MRRAAAGAAELDTSLLAEPLTDGAYLAAPSAGPFETLLSLYGVGEGCDAVVKLAGRADADSLTGQLTTTGHDNSQVSQVAQRLAVHGCPRHPARRTATRGRARG